ncbi:MAG: acetolactate synthase small subunit [Chloroflexota bacterium]|nr:acetolactate synthase small subunit [Chloroflexota bacterium]
MEEKSKRLTTVVAYVQDRPGVLAKVSMVLRRRNFNIATLVGGHSARPGVSRMTIVVAGAAPAVKQVEKQLYKVIEVLKVFDLAAGSAVLKEVALIRIATNSSNRAEVIGLAQVFGGRVDDVGRNYVMIELTASPYSIDRFLRVANDFGVMELARTGAVAMSRGEKIISAPVEEAQKSHNGQGTSY